MFDIAIVGAGPAAAIFAGRIQKKGKSILLIDGQNEKHPKPCGGLLSPDAQKLLASFNFTLPNHILVSPQIFSVKTLDLCSGQIRYYPRYYLNMDRLKFDQFLLDKMSEDVTVLKGFCREIYRQADGSFVLKVVSDGEEKNYTSKTIVGADGANSLVRKTFFPSRKIPQYVAIQQWIPYSGTQAPYYSCIFDPKTSESCSWTIHKNGYLIYGGCFQKENCREMFEKQKKRLTDFLDISLEEAEKTEACLVDRPHRLRDFVTGHDGVYLIGEAAGFISPSSFEGLSFAMKSGILLAEAFLDSTEKELAGKYRRKTLSLRFRLWLKMRKRWFMYTPKIRYLIMKSGLASVKMLNE